MTIEGPKELSRAAKLLWRKNITLRFLAIGLWNTLVGYAIFFGLYLLFSSQTNYMLIAFLSHVLAVTQSFTTQRQIVFCSSGNWLHEYIRFHIAHLGSLMAGLAALPVLVEVFTIPPLIAQGILTVVIVTASYFIHHYFTFSKANNV